MWPFTFIKISRRWAFSSRNILKNPRIQDVFCRIIPTWFENVPMSLNIMLIVTRRDPFYGVIQHLIEILWVQPRHGKFNGHPKIMGNFAQSTKTVAAQLTTAQSCVFKRFCPVWFTQLWTEVQVAHEIPTSIWQKKILMCFFCLRFRILIQSPDLA